jgi:hypothetical protein
MSDNIKLINELYSLANKNKILPRLIIKNNDIFDTLLNVIKDKFSKNISIQDIYEDLMNNKNVINNDIEINDIVIIYYILVENIGIDDDFKKFIFNNLRDDMIHYFNKKHFEWNPNFELLTIINNNQKFDLLEFIELLVVNNGYNINMLIDEIKDVKKEYIIIAYFYFLTMNGDENAVNTIEEEYGDNISEIFKDIDFDSYEDWKKFVTLKTTDLTPLVENLISRNFELIDIIKKLNKYNVEDIIMNYYELSNEENIINKIYFDTDWLVNSYIQEKHKTWTAINNTEYDDSDRITLLKWRYYRQKYLGKEFPLTLSLIRPRSQHDKLKINGTEKLIFESLPDIIMGSITNGKQNPADLYSYIKTNSKGLINEDDIVMTYYELYITDPESVKHITEMITDSIIKYNKEKRPIVSKKVTKDKNPDDIVDIINEFFILMGSDKSNIDHEEWREKIEISIKDENDAFDTMINTYLQFLSYDKKLEFLNIRTISSLKSFNPTLHGIPITIEDGYDIFNKSKISQHIPFICYNDSHGKSLFKVFNPRESINEINNYDNITHRYKFILPKDKLKDKDTIYMTMWLGSDDVSIFKSPQKSFFIVIYHLDGNKLTIESTVKDESENIFSLTNSAYLYAQEGLPSIIFGNGQDIKTRLEFDIKNYSINEYIFVDYLLTDNLMKNYLYIDESKDSFAMKKRLDVHYNLLFEENINAAVSFTITQKMDDLPSSKRPVEGGNPLLHINVTQADPDAVDKFMIIFEKLLLHYKDRTKDCEVKKIYDNFFPGMIDDIQNYLEKKRESKQKQEKRIKTLISTDKNIKQSNKPLELSSKGSGIIKNPGKSLSTNGRGYIPKNLESILNNYSNERNNESKFVRYGTTNYPNNSLLHCVCYAIDHPDYIDIKDEKLKELYIIKLRTFISNNIELSLLKQELFDYSDDEITKLLASDSEFFDPSLLYRAVEEIFNINLYVFTYNEKNEIEIPRNKIFHSRPHRLYRPTILITKIITGDYEIPKCELIVDYNDQKLEIIKLFGESMTNICHNLILQNYNSTITISRIEVPSLSLQTLTRTENKSEENQFVGHDNIYYYIDNMKIFNNNIVSQLLDNDGKMRAIIVNINNQMITISIHPSQPENVPILTDIKLTTVDNAIDIFGEPSGVTLNNENNINGLWFKILDLTYGYYIPIIPTNNKLLNNIPIGPDNPLLFMKTNVTFRLRKMKRTINIITELIKWLYIIRGLKVEITPYLFQKQYFRVKEQNIDSSDFYDLSNIERKLPDMTSIHDITDAINIMSKLAPTLFDRGKIIMYSEEFSSRIKDMLINYDAIISSNKIKAKTIIDNFYMTTDDYIKSQNTKIFLSRKDLDNWLLSLKSSREDKNLLHTTTGLSNSLSLEPYIFQTEKNNIYIVQNTGDKTPNKSLTISKLWQENHINYGPNISTGLISEPHFIYGISSNSQLYPIVDNTNNESDYLEILYYGSQAEYKGDVKSTYAALLKLI